MMGGLLYLLQLTRKGQHRIDAMIYVLPAIIIGAVVYDLYADWKGRTKNKEQ